MADETTIRQRKPLRTTTGGNTTQANQKGSKGSRLGSCISRLFVTFIAIIAAVALFTFTRDNKINAVEYKLTEPPVYQGPLSENSMLSKAVRLLESQIKGPESLLLHKGSIYTGTSDGKIVEIKDGKIVRTLRTPRFECGSYEDEPRCGRPLGLRAMGDSYIVFVDAYHGLFKLDILTGKTETLVDGSTTVDGKPMGFLNDVAILESGTILFTDSSSRYPRRDFMLIILEHSTDGRLMAYDPKTKKVTVLMDNIAFANGLEVAPDESFVVVSELANARILKYNLKGPKSGKKEIFADNLPGLPDNIRLSKNGSFWVAIGQMRKKEKPSMVDILAPYPKLRNFIAKVVPAKHFSTISHYLPKYGLVLLIDQSGKIVSTLHDPTGRSVAEVSEVLDTGKSLYLGSYIAPYLSKLDY